MRAALLSLALLLCLSGVSAAEPPPAPDPYLAGPESAVGPASVAGTRWRVTMSWSDGAATNVWTWAEFQSDGQLNYGYADGRSWTNGRWRQRGSVLVFDANSMFMVGVGQIEGDRIAATSTNVRGVAGHWVFEREN